jgi:Tfp pilus assembly protein PilN
VSQVNLLPPEIRVRQQLRRRTGLVVLAGVAVLGLVLFLFMLQSTKLATVEDQLAQQQSTNQQLQAQISDLQRFADLQSLLQQKQSMLGVVYGNEVQWSAILQDVARQIPDDSYLRSLQGQVGIGTGATEAPVSVDTGEPTGIIGSVSFEGQGYGVETVALWITRLEQVRGFVNAWVSTATKVSDIAGAFDFSSTIDLTDQVVTKRGKAATG